MIAWACLASAAALPLACSGDDAARSDRSATPIQESPRQHLLIVGTSLTAGLGVSPDSAYPALLQRRIDSRGLSWEVVNAGVSGETAAGGLRRATWLFREPFGVLLLELGANDGLRGTDPDSVRETLQTIIDLARSHAPGATIVLAGMEAPPNLGPRYTSRFRAIFPDLATTNGLPLIPFLLEGVAGVDSLNQGDRIHPNAAGHRVLAATVWKVLDSIIAVP